MSEKIDPKLINFLETMLWTLHNRACEAMRPDGIIKDPKCVAIHQSLDYDYQKSFGKPDALHAVHSIVCDDVIVNLGEGLEAQRFIYLFVA